MKYLRRVVLMERNYVGYKRAISLDVWSNGASVSLPLTCLGSAHVRLRVCNEPPLTGGLTILPRTYITAQRILDLKNHVPLFILPTMSPESNIETLGLDIGVGHRGLGFLACVWTATPCRRNQTAEFCWAGYGVHAQQVCKVVGMWEGVFNWNRMTFPPIPSKTQRRKELYLWSLVSMLTCLLTFI